MKVSSLQCIICSKSYSNEEIRVKCDCGESLDIIYEKASNVLWQTLRERPFNHWRYKEFFPDVKDIVTLQEGGTPLIKSRNISLNIEIFFKYEGLNPTGSFKDRGTTVEISKALDMGASEVICASTGNMGASVAAYSAVAGIKSTIVVPKTTSLSKIKQILSYGAMIRKVPGDFTTALKKAVQESQEKNYYLTGDYPYRCEGEKSIIFEILDQVDADYIICPVGNGTMISALYKGLTEMKYLGIKIPQIIAVQAAGCNPIIKAHTQNKEIQGIKPRTKASAIACGFPIDGNKALLALRIAKTHTVEVTDKEMQHAKELLAEKEGIYSELAGAAPLAALMKIKLPTDKKVVLLVTGHGLKE